MKKFLVAAIAAAALATPALTLPASASVTGAVVLHCTAHLPTWPVATPTNAGDCTGGTLPGIEADVAAGVSTAGSPYVVAGPGTFSVAAGALTYDEECVSGEPPLIGFASGTAHSNGATAVEVLNAATKTANLTIGFNWTRVGAVAVVTLGSAHIDFKGATGLTTDTADSAVNVAGTSGAAVAAFAPTTVPLPTCAAPGPLTAEVIGVAAAAA